MNKQLFDAFRINGDQGFAAEARPFIEWVVRQTLGHWGQQANVDDVVQDVFVRLLKKGRQFNPQRGRLKSWICRIAINTAVDHLRTLNRNLNVPLANGAAQAAGNMPTPDEIVSEWEKHECLRQVLQEMMEDENATTSNKANALRYRFWCDMTYSEIAEQMGGTEAEVNNWIYRGKQELRTRLEQKRGMGP